MGFTNPRLSIDHCQLSIEIHMSASTSTCWHLTEGVCAVYVAPRSRVGWEWAQRTLESKDDHAQSKVSLSFCQFFTLELERSPFPTGQYFAFPRQSSAHVCTELCHFLL